MCKVCENPRFDVDAEDDLDGIREVVRYHGWVIKCVEDDVRPYGYTIGLHLLGLPELLITGVATDLALAALDYFTHDVVENGAPDPGDHLALEDAAMFEVVEVECPDVHMGLGIKALGPELRGLQLVWADTQGRWPWDAAFDGDGMAQPVLGVRAQKRSKY